MQLIIGSIKLQMLVPQSDREVGAYVDASGLVSAAGLSVG